MTDLQTLRLVALNIDGVLLPDTFSPVVHRFLERHGATYTPELERLVVSTPQVVGGTNMAAAARLPWSWQDTIAAFFDEREAYLAEHPMTTSAGAVELLERLRFLGVSTVCYGGLSEEHFEKHLGQWGHYFAEPRYICTNDFRPGITEIVRDYFGLPEFRQALFVDDVNRFAEFAKHLGVAFVGVPSPHPASAGRRHMQETGVRHIVSSLDAIDVDLIRDIDLDASRGTLWTS